MLQYETVSIADNYTLLAFRLHQLLFVPSDIEVITLSRAQHLKRFQFSEPEPRTTDFYWPNPSGHRERANAIIPLLQ